MKRIFVSLILGGLLSLCLAASVQARCPNASQTNSDSIIVIGGDYNYPPFEYLNAKGEPDGFNVDVVRAVAKEMGLHIKIELGPWSEVRKLLEDGKIDALMGMYYSSERDKKVDFSIPHFISSYSLFVRDSSNIKEFKDIRNRKVIAQLDDLGYDYIKENHITSHIISKGDWKETLKSLSRGEGDCAIVSRVQGVMLIHNLNLKNIHAVGQPILQQKYCMAVAEGNSGLLATFNEGLSTLKATGQYEVIYEKWFGLYEEKVVSKDKLIRFILWLLIPLVGAMLLVGAWVTMLRRQVLRKTKELELELKEHKITEQKLVENEQRLTVQNEEYAVVYEELKWRNSMIESINEQLTIAKEKAEDSNRLKSAFLANMSHEIRTPLNGIVGFSALLARKELSETKRNQYSEIVNNNAQRLLALLSDILDFSKIETGQIVITLRPVVLNEVFAELFAIYQPQVESKQLKLILNTSVEGEVLVNTDKQRLFQVLINLLSNALKFTSAGEIVFGYEVQGHQVCCYVRDSGIGIEPAYLVTIFERFSQGNPEHSRQGTGLGLAIAKSLVALLGGEIWVNSKVGEGSTFYFTIPYEPK